MSDSTTTPDWEPILNEKGLVQGVQKSAPELNTTTGANDFPRLNINTEELRTEVEMLLAAAAEDAENMGAVNWGDLGIADIQYRLSMLQPQDGPHCMIMIEEASPECNLPKFLYENWNRAKFPNVDFECEW